jgi:hypothetical protein
MIFEKQYGAFFNTLVGYGCRKYMALMHTDAFGKYAVSHSVHH